MEYVGKQGTKVIVEGNKVQFDGGVKRKFKIGANFVNGIILGGYLSSFNDSFNEELIGIEFGIGDIIDAKIGDIKDAYESLRFKINNMDHIDVYELSRIVLEIVDNYFGGFSNIEERFKYYYLEGCEKNNKISNLKGTGAAMCVERAALAQNLLRFLGINSFYKSSGIIRNNNKEIHSYNLIEYDSKFYIFDTSIPNLIDKQINPLIAEIDEDTFVLLSAPISDIGISVTVQHYNPFRHETVNITYDSNREKHIEVNPLGAINKKHL
jgi:hypothetical protein